MIPDFPSSPGCYLFKDNQGTIIYVGKAKELKKRVSSYFQKRDHDAKTQLLVSLISDAEFIVTANEVEALILENNLIKKHQPKYNINLKDAKRYAFIMQTDEPVPRLLIARRDTGEGRLYGPFVSAEERDEVLRLVRRLFQIRTCKKLPKKPCLRYHIGLCTAPCAGYVTREQYMEQVKKAGKVLSGQIKELMKELESDMKDASLAKEFERAMQLRDQIRALSYLEKKQNVERQKKYDEDIINYIVSSGRVYLMVFNVHQGILNNKQDYDFDLTDDFLAEFLVQYYSENDVPRELIVPEQIDAALQQFLEKRRDGVVTVTVPKIGEKTQLLELVKKNIEIAFFGDRRKVEALAEKLNLQSMPTVIECFDVSHLSGTATVGSMVQFQNGKPDKSNYRRFKIRTVEDVDDFASIAEIVSRRYSRLKNEQGQVPDLIVIDGGMGQLHAALAELEKLGMKIPMISLAKRLEEIYLPGSRFPLRLDHKETALKYLQEIRDEAHRFALKYNRLLRHKKIRK